MRKMLKYATLAVFILATLALVLVSYMLPVALVVGSGWSIWTGSAMGMALGYLFGFAAKILERRGAAHRRRTAIRAATKEFNSMLNKLREEAAVARGAS